jgi:hypothetical protein
MLRILALYYRSGVCTLVILENKANKRIKMSIATIEYRKYKSICKKNIKYNPKIFKL